MAFSQTARIGACVFCLGFISFLLAIFAETSKVLSYISIYLTLLFRTKCYSEHP